MLKSQNILNKVTVKYIIQISSGKKFKSHWIMQCLDVYSAHHQQYMHTQFEHEMQCFPYHYIRGEH